MADFFDAIVAWIQEMIGKLDFDLGDKFGAVIQGIADFVLGILKADGGLKEFGL